MKTAEDFINDNEPVKLREWRDTMVEFAQYHVRKAIEEIAKHENPDAPKHIFEEDVEYVQKMYPLENIKPCSD